MPKQARIAPVSLLAARAASAATASAIVPETVKAHEGAPNQNEEDEAKIAPVVPVTVAKKKRGLVDVYQRCREVRKVSLR